MLIETTPRQAHAAYAEYARRCSELGLLCWECDRRGVIITEPEATPQQRAELQPFPDMFVKAAAQACDKLVVTLLVTERGTLLVAGDTKSVFVAVRASSAFGGIDETVLCTILSRYAHDLVTKCRDDEALIQFSDRLSQSYEEVSLLFRMARMLNYEGEPYPVIQNVCAQFRETLPLSWLAVSFTSDSRVRSLSNRLISAGELPCQPATLSSLVSALIVNTPVDQWKRVLHPTQSDLGSVSQSEVVAERILHDGACVGAIVAGNTPGRDPDVTSAEIQMLGAFADFLGIYHENSARFEEQHLQFMGTLRSLTAAIDAKDAYTCGHSDRVALLARELGKLAGMDEHTLERLHVAGLVHDVGKIGVSEQVLGKTGKLTDAEFEQIKRHPEIGHRILRDIPGMSDVLPGVLHHHERWDGKGYPHGLVGEQIPLMARILAMADTFDAMSSTRSYRRSMSREHVFKEMRACAGTQFDPGLLPLLDSLDLTQFDSAVQTETCKAA